MRVSWGKYPYVTQVVDQTKLSALTQRLMDSASTPVSMDIIPIIEGSCRAGCVIDVDGGVWAKPNG